MLRRTAFTLVELLVAIGVVALLIGLLLPALGAARAQAAALRCQANLRQWVVAMQVYAQENRGFLPRRGQGEQPTAVIDRPSDWFNALPPILKTAPYSSLVAAGRAPRAGSAGVWMCPALGLDAGETYLFAYGMNMRLSTWVTPLPDRIDKLGPPHTFVFMSDAWGPHCSVLPSAKRYSPADRHSRRVNVSFIDGHVASFDGKEIGCGASDPQRLDLRWKPPGSIWTGPAN